VITWRGNPAREAWAWALDLKNGLGGDLLPNLPQAEREHLKKGLITLQARMLKLPFSTLTAPEIALLEHGLGKQLGKALRSKPAPAWTTDLPAEYDRGPADQAPRHLFVQSIFDRM
jgi:hypothetical protein